MSQKESHSAFILRAIPYAERDLMVTLFTEERGLRSALAKNARSSKRFAGGVQLFRKVEAILQPRPNVDLDLFLEMRVLSHYPRVEASYEKITVGSYGAELLRELGQGDADAPHLFALLDAFYTRLDALDDDPRAIEALLRHFELNLLHQFGALPSLHACHRCGMEYAQMERLQLKRSGEGLLCGVCRQPGEAVGGIEPETLAALHYYASPDGPLPDVLGSPEVRLQARRVMQNSFRLILQKELKSSALLDVALA